MAHILLTGAAGRLGQVLMAGLLDAGHTLVASDIAPLPAPPPKGVSFVQADLGDRAAVMAMTAEVDGIVHFGAIPIELTFEEILNGNLRGAAHVFEGARQRRARVVFASSNHTIGYHERTTLLTEDCPFRPDGYYGLSKVYGEMLARLMFDKHGIESASLRIGSCLPKPTDRRHLSTWLSYPDLLRLVTACLTTPNLGCRAVWGMSANSDAWWRPTNWAEIGYHPADDARRFADSVDMAALDPVSERYQGGTFTADRHTRPWV